MVQLYLAMWMSGTRLLTAGAAQYSPAVTPSTACAASRAIGSPCKLTIWLDELLIRLSLLALREARTAPTLRSGTRSTTLQTACLGNPTMDCPLPAILER